MGPLYHLTLEEDRKRAVGEAKRILKPKGLIFAALITRYAPIRWTAKYEPASTHHLEFAKKALDIGVWKGTEHAYRFGRADCYFARPSEIRPLMEEEGFETLAIVGCESAVSMVDEKVNELSGELFDSWVDINYKMGKDPDAYGAAEHLLYVGRKAKE
jgi:SAM-dependent methyltransferase